jgi:hypothetical protein
MSKFTISISLGLAAWLVFVASFFLPATNVLEAEHTPPSTPLTGWEAFWTSANLPRNWTLYRMVFRTHPRVLLFGTFPFVNLAMFIAPVAIWRRPRFAGWLSIVTLCGGIAALLLPKDFTKDLFVGFYCWLGSLFTMALACIIASGWRLWRTERTRDATQPVA